MDEALVEQPAAQPPPGQGPSLLTIVGLPFLALNAAMAVYSFDKGLGTISFVAFVYLDLVLLVYCLALHEGTAPGSARREHLEVAVWLLTTMLTFAFWPLLEFIWFLMAANVAENPSMSFQNHTSCAQLHSPYLPAVP